ncbi:hypothetical protein ABXS75_18805 [Roseburia hominis]
MRKQMIAGRVRAVEVWENKGLPECQGGRRKWNGNDVREPAETCRY